MTVAPFIYHPHPPPSLSVLPNKHSFLKKQKNPTLSLTHSIRVNSSLEKGSPKSILMALRPLDNALPVTPERPKKQVKIAISIQKQSDVPVNDENRAPLPPPATATDSIDYISSENLKPISDPESKIQSLVEGLESKDWLKVCDSLNNARRFSLYHSNLLLPIMEKVMLVLVKSMKNPRSALVKTSIMASSDLFKAYGDMLLESPTSDAFDHMLLQLLLKASQDKRFVCEEADRSLSTMVRSTTPLILLHKLKGYVSHANMRVRAKAAISISHSVSKMEFEEMKEYGLVSLIHMAAELLKDRLPEAREAARRIVTMMHKAITENEEEGKGEEGEEGEEEEEEEKKDKWQSFCQCNLAAIDALAIFKIVPSQ